MAKSYNFRIGQEGLEEFRRAMESLGETGDRAFQKLADV